jgi:hypothetical protein
MTSSREPQDFDGDEDDDLDFLFEKGSSFPLEENWLEQSPLAIHIRRDLPFDPLGLIPLCSRRVRELSLIVDMGELVRATLASIAIDCQTYHHALPLEPWLLDHVDQSLRDLVTADIEAERSEDAEPPEGGRFVDLEMILGIDPAQARLACIALNTLDDETRHIFYEVCLMHRSVRDMMREGFPIERAQELVERAMKTVKEILARPRKAVLQDLGKLVEPPQQGMGEEANPR